MHTSRLQLPLTERITKHLFNQCQNEDEEIKQQTAIYQTNTKTIRLIKTQERQEHESCLELLFSERVLKDILGQNDGGSHQVSNFL